MTTKTNKTSTYTARRYTPADAGLWNDFVTTAKNATFLFHRDFMDYHSDRFTDFSVLIYKDVVLYAVLPANVKENKVVSHQGLTYGSFVLQDSAKLLYALEAFKEMLRFLSSEKLQKLEIRVIPTFYNVMPSDELAYFMFKANATLLKRDV